LKDYVTFEDVAADIPRFLDEVCNHRRLDSAPGYLGAARREAGRPYQKGRTAMLRGPRNGCILPRQLAATLEHVPKKLLDFFDSGMLQFFEFELRPYRSKDSI
jgi:hypothetical protein